MDDERIAERLTELAERIDRLEERLARLEQPADDSEPATPSPPRLQHWRTTVGQWGAPRLGVHRQHSPRPLMIPARYLRTRPPRDPPRISIVTPSFQQSAFLPRAIESVLSQEYPNLEYVVEDGGSTDGSVEMLERYDQLLTRWGSQPDDGQASALNHGFDGTSGEIMGWLNSDDLLLPGSLAGVARYFARHPKVDAVYGNRVLVDESDAHVGSWILPRHDDRMLTLLDCVPQETLFWRRRLWERVGGHVDERFRFALDWELLLRFRAAGATMVRIPSFLGAFRVHGDQKNETLSSVATEETDRLREQLHGRALDRSEVYALLRPYMRRHLVLHTAHRALERLPLPRVQALPEMRLDRSPMEGRQVGERVPAP
jgi:GT2 family glycosyltransferase